MKPFDYLNKTYTPIKSLENTMSAIARRIGITKVEGYNYADFYAEATKAEAGDVSVFECEGSWLVPVEIGLVEVPKNYHENDPAWNKNKEKTLYQALLDAGIEGMGNHETDLYVPVSEKARAIIAQYPLQQKNTITFRSNIDKTMQFEIPFAYDPAWNRNKEPSTDSSPSI